MHGGSRKQVEERRKKRKGEGQEWMEWSDSSQAKHENQVIWRLTLQSLPPPPRPPRSQWLMGLQYLKPLHLHLLELCLVLQVTDDSFLPADNGAVHGGLLQVLDTKLSHLQLGTLRSPLAPLTRVPPLAPLLHCCMLDASAIQPSL